MPIFKIKLKDPAHCVHKELLLRMWIADGKKAVSVAHKFKKISEFRDAMKCLTKSGEKSLKEKFGLK